MNNEADGMRVVWMSMNVESLKGAKLVSRQGWHRWGFAGLGPIRWVTALGEHCGGAVDAASLKPSQSLPFRTLFFENLFCRAFLIF
jgi:hypothetical protein